jgi:hypothetical protein
VLFYLFEGYTFRQAGASINDGLRKLLHRYVFHFPQIGPAQIHAAQVSP